MSGCRIFIGRLSPSAREKDVERFFKGYGRIRDIDLKRGFGFVEFDDPRDAEDAVYELDGKELCNERVTIEHARVRLRGGRGRGGGAGGGRFSDRYGRGSQNSRSRNPPPMRTENRLIVENLSSRVSWQVSIAKHVFFEHSKSLTAATPPPTVCLQQYTHTILEMMLKDNIENLFLNLISDNEFSSLIMYLYNLYKPKLFFHNHGSYQSAFNAVISNKVKEQ